MVSSVGKFADDPDQWCYVALEPDQWAAEYVGDGTWRVLNGTFSAAKRGEQNPYWVYICNTLSGDGVSFEEASEAVSFLAGQYMADKWHQEMNEKMEAARQQSDEHEASRLTQPE